MWADLEIQSVIQFNVGQLRDNQRFNLMWADLEIYSVIQFNVGQFRDIISDLI